MDKQIPIYFDTVIVDSPFQGISESNPNIGRLKVRVFTKYGNRNGSYITEAVANQLIESAIQGNTPVVGFFDPSTSSWASHSGPTLANAYGYVESFLGWEPYTDTDGVSREYAIFSVILFTDYYEEAKKILGQNQSMELDPSSITGEWTTIENQEYYVYKTAKMLGFCVIGEHEPCFSVSSFFSKNDNIYDSQSDKFSSLLFNLKTLVEEAEKNKEGGEQPMNDFENQELEISEQEAEVVNPQIEESQEPVEIFEETVNAEALLSSLVVETAEENSETETEEVVEQGENEEEISNEPSEFETLQNQFNELQESYNQLSKDFEQAQARIAELETMQTNSNTELENLRVTLQTYEAQASAAEVERKNNLIEKYEKILSAEEISPIKDNINDFSYDILESKLAITFANRQMASGDVKKVPLPDPERSQFALLMEKYRKN